MQNWEITIGARVTECSLKGASGKQKKVQVDCDKSCRETVIQAVHANLFPLENGNLDGWQRRNNYFFVKVTTIAGAVELRDKILAIMDKYKQYISGKEETPESQPETETPKAETPETGTPETTEEKSSPILAIVIVAVLAYILYEYL